MNNDDFTEITELEGNLFLARVRDGSDIWVVGYYHSRESAIAAIRATGCITVLGRNIINHAQGSAL